MTVLRCLAAGLLCLPLLASAGSPPAADAVEEQPWDYRPYRVLIWIATDDPALTAAVIERPLRNFLQRDFHALWRLDLADAPTSVRSLAERDLAGAGYDALTAADPVLAVKRDHPEAVRIRVAANVGQFCQRVLATPTRIAQVAARAAEAGDPSIGGVAPRLTAMEGDALSIGELWKAPETEALLVARGMAQTLTEPEAKIIEPPISGLINETIERYDKVFLVHIRSRRQPGQVRAVELDTLMRHLGPVTEGTYVTRGNLTATVGRAISRAFAPLVRIENAGQRSATGLLRGGGLILAEDSPGYIGVGDVLEPMVRKDDRNGRPFVIGPIDWALLYVRERQDRYLEMDYYAGRAGTLQGRKNDRTFRMALKARPQHDATVLRLHLKDKPNFPLIGYELYERSIDSADKSFQFVGRTDWNGRARIEPTDDPLRLLYVKNGGAVLARLPLAPGLYPHAVADLSGDDMRLQAEAYVNGVRNEITDLVAIRELYKARIGLKLQAGELEQAEELMIELRSLPDNKDLSDAVSAKQTEFLNAIGRRNIGQRRKVDEMFTTTRELLAKHITPSLVRELEADLQTARDHGGRLPDQQGDTEPDPAAETAADGEGEGEPSAAEQSAEQATSAAPSAPAT